MKKLIFYSVLAVVFLSVSCKPKALLTVGLDSGDDISIKKRQQFEITLPSNPTTGMKWSVASIDSTKISLVKQEYVANSVATNPMMGSGGIEKLTFKAVSKGTTPLGLNYGRASEAPSMTKKYQVTVE